MSEVINFPEKKSKKENSKIGAVIILIISALVFLPFGASAIFESFFQKRNVSTFGSYDGHKITYEPGSKFYQATSNIAQSYQSAGYQVDDKMYYYILAQAFRQTILDYALTGEVKKSGYTVSKEAVNRAILPAFTDENGNFSQRIYNQVNQADIDKLKKNAEGQLTYSRYIDDVFATSGVNGQEKIRLYGVKHSEAEKAFLAKMGEEKHSFEIAAFNTDDYPESEAVEYGKNHADKFVKYNLSVITVDEESEAKSILKQINANEITFEDALSEKSQKYYSDADGKLPGGYTFQIESAIDNSDDLSKITELGTDTMSGIIKTKRGYSIFKGTADKVVADFSDAETIRVALAYMKQAEKGLIEEYYTKLAADFTSEAAIASFDKACEKFNIEKKDVLAFPVNYGNTDMYAKTSDVAEIASIANNASAYKTMFSLKMDEISAPFILGNKVIVAKCSGIQKDDVSNETDSMASSVYQADQTAMQNTVMTSDKVVDNFFATYLDMMSAGKK